ncbi:MAG: methyltransferase domain-containing protein [Syntrophaceae bacterium]|nr:methyltransferase domain-containing protein [Syntrophaceae bacterium]
MESVTDWIRLWRELVEWQDSFRYCFTSSEKEKDRWKKRAKGFDESARERWAKPDPLRDFIVSMVMSIKDSTVLDIGAGTGAWAVFLSKFVRKVTAIEPSESMRSVLGENLKKEGIHNVEVFDGIWPEVDIGSHDFSLSSHSAYGCADLPGFVDAMAKATRRTCFLLLRAPDPAGVMARAARMVWGQPNDSPNFQVAYNAMLQMGIFPNVLMEEKGLWPGWTNKSLDEAFEKIRSRFAVEEDSKADQCLRTLLKEHLKEVDGRVEWPSEVRTALVYWNTVNHVL